MRVIYIANARIPTEKAHGVQIMNMCEAFSRQKMEVELVLPRRLNPIKDDPFNYYGVDKIFKITKLPSIDLVKFGKIGFWIQSFSFSKFAEIYTLIKSPDIIYSRDKFSLFWLSFFKKNIFWETHNAEFNFITRRLLKKCRGIIAITQCLKDFYISKEVNTAKILVASDAVNFEKFNLQISKAEARQELMKRNSKINLPPDKKIILYTGRSYNWKGVDILRESSAFFTEPGYLVVFVGKTNEDIETIDTEYFITLGYRPPNEIPYWLKAADVLVLPNSAKEKISEFYTSPLKMFEYMVSGVPIVASDLPSIREILNESNAILVKPDSPEFLSAGILKALKNPDFSAKIAKQAYLDVQNYTWGKRAEKIISFIIGK